MRGTATGLASPHPLGTLLPAVFQEDPLAMRLTAALDDVLAPAVATLDCLHCYVDPHVAPGDFVAWLASWVGIADDEAWPAERLRATVARAISLYHRRGTVAGLRDEIEVVTGGRVEVIDSGGISASAEPREAPEVEPPHVTVSVHRTDESLEFATIDALVAAAKPAYATHRVELTDRGAASG
jgi:phage tail-like protein